MSAGSSPNETPQSLSILKEVDAACDRFEAEWRSGARPQIRAYLARASREARRRLLQELLRVDIAYRRKHGGQPQAGDYKSLSGLFDATVLNRLLAPPAKPQPEPVTPAPVSQAQGRPPEARAVHLATTVPHVAHVETAPAPPRLFGDYEIVKELGKGGMGIVYLARQRSANRLVALKLIRMDRLEHLTPKQRKEWLTRFRTECQATARVSDDRVVTVYEVGTHDGHPFYSMRYVAGRSLAAVLEPGPLSNRPAAILIEQVARAVQAVHDQGVLHRDLKPHNILIDAQGRPFVSDFGLAKWLDTTDSPTQTGEMLGSPQYMSPEQVQDAAHVSAATDVYGLGATLYAALTGRPPFQGTTVAETLHKVKYEEPKPPRRVNPAVDRDLDTITLKCLEKEPALRFGSAAEVADELRLYLEGRPIRTRPIGPAGRLWRWRRRNPALAALSAAAVVLLAVAGALYWAYWSRGQQVTQVEEKGKQEVARVTDAGKQVAQDKKRLEYLEDMSDVQKHIEAKELPKARELLARWKPQEGEPDYRGWEWHFMNAQIREAPFSVRGHTSAVQAVAWNPDGTKLASADREGTVKVWEVATGKMLREFATQAGGVVAVAWSPGGKRLTAACPGAAQDGRGAFPGFPGRPAMPPGGGAFPAVPGQPVNPAPAQGKGQPNPAAPPPAQQRGQQAPGRGGPGDSKPAAQAAQGIVKVWDVDSGKALPDLRMAPGITDDVNFLGIPPPANPGPEAAAAQSAQHVFLGSWSNCMDWSPIGQKLALADPIGRVQIWDMGTGKGPLVVDAHKGCVSSMSWNPDGKRLATLGSDTMVKVWDAATGKEAPALGVRMTYEAMPMTGFALTWADRGKQLHVASSDGEIRILDPASGKQIATRKLEVREPMERAGLTRFRGGFVWAPDGKGLASVDSGGVSIWDLATGKQGPPIQTPGTKTDRIMESMMTAPMIGKACAPAWDRDGRRLALGQVDGTVQTVRADGKRVAVRSPVRNALAWSIDGKRLLGSPDMSGVGADAMKDTMKATRAHGQQLMEEIQRRKAAGLPLDPKMFMGQGQGRVIDQRPEHQIQVSDAITGAVIRAIGKGKERGVSLPGALAESPDGKWLASATGTGLLQLWPATGGEQPITLEEPPAPKNPPERKPINPIVFAWSPDGKQLASSSTHDTAIHLWDPVTRKPVRTLDGHAKPLRSLTWSVDGKRLASADDGGSVRIWDVAAGKESYSFTYYANQGRLAPQSKTLAPSMLSWCSDGKRLAVAGEDETIKIWDVEAGEVIATPPLPGPRGNVLVEAPAVAVAWSPDGKRLAAVNRGKVLLWDVATWQLVLTLPTAAAGRTLAWSLDGWQLASFGGDLTNRGSVTIWDATPEKEQ
jgi:WD40 repeat protein/predicted Ser/Thr protein kinase